jgi:hypothetical protein
MISIGVGGIGHIARIGAEFATATVSAADFGQVHALIGA